MKKVILLVLISLFLAFPVFADRVTHTTKGFTASQLVKRGDWRIYRINFIATSNGGDFAIYDNLTNGNGSVTLVKTESSEATAKNAKVLDFSDNPLEGSTGLYLTVTTASVVIEYD